MCKTLLSLSVTIAVYGVCCLPFPAQAIDPSAYSWRPETIDQIEIGYGVQLADVDGDGKTDIVLADKSTIQWYQSPSWTKHIIAKDLTERDNVCVTARDIDGDGKCEIAVGGQWNFRESVKDGAVFYLDAPEDRTQMWKPIKLHHEPSTHRMHWVKGVGDQYHLVVKPLRGKGSVEGVGPGLKVLAYQRPEKHDAQWPYHVVSDSLHLSHNFHPVNWDDDAEEELIIAAKEGVWHFDPKGEQWSSTQLTDAWAGEVRDGRLPGGKRFIATVEPMHGSASAVYVQSDSPDSQWTRAKVLDEALKDGHALACADFLGNGSDQVVVGWRAMNDPGVPGIKLFTPLDAEGSQWHELPLSQGTVAVEDIKVGDLNGDGKVDIVAAARQTKNLVIFWNER
ncbi:FG-GAP repeat domain-containing protein [Stieleria varia]|uniref:FG-GAP repeat protein n=1 Tax=Stieleria varia TaxID=2528005 RepID=A0A5C6AZF7_9BACT|nr:VCBS repeat-containing protein [Stieleria varia]TWU04887.1 FG-GAP repeat protein [Stieleria varia]